MEVDRRVRRWFEQRWLVDGLIESVGVDWDQPRSRYLQYPCGLDAGPDFEFVRRRVRKFADIAPAFAEAAARREREGARAAAEGHAVAAGEHYFTASILWGGAQWPIFDNTPQVIDYNEHKIDCYERYMASADHPIERVEIPFGKGSLPGYLHLPRQAAAGERFPCVLSIDGMDSLKEALCTLYGDKYLTRGIARLCLDGPGQGECPVRQIWVTATNHADAGQAALAWLRTRQDIDPDRLAVSGVSFGSFWATQMAADDERLAGCAVAMVCHEPGGATIFDAASPSFKLRFMYMAGISDEVEFDRFAQDLTLHGWGERVRCPYLVVAGEEDELSPIEHTYALLESMPGPHTFLLYAGEGHTMGLGPAGQRGPHWMTFTADWLSDRFAGQPLASERLYVDTNGRIQSSRLNDGPDHKAA